MNTAPSGDSRSETREKRGRTKHGTETNRSRRPGATGGPPCRSGQHRSEPGERSAAGWRAPQEKASACSGLGTGAAQTSTLGARAPALVALLSPPIDQSLCLTNRKTENKEQADERPQRSNKKRPKSKALEPKFCTHEIRLDTNIFPKNHRLD